MVLESLSRRSLFRWSGRVGLALAAAQLGGVLGATGAAAYSCIDCVGNCVPYGDVSYCEYIWNDSPRNCVVTNSGQCDSCGCGGVQAYTVNCICQSRCCSPG